MQAEAVVAIAPGRVAFQSVSVPDPGADDVVIRITHSWISNGTEGSFVRGERIAGDTPRAETDPLPFPHVPGYQTGGVVDQVGSGVTDLAVGDTVFATVSRVEGMFYAHGGHVSPAVTHRSQVWKLPAGVDPVAASGLVLTQVGYNVGTQCALEPGAATIVLGDGMVGHWAAQTLRHQGARVLLVGKHDERLALWEASAEDLLVNIERENLLEVARSGAQVAGVLCAVCGASCGERDPCPDGIAARGDRLGGAGDVRGSDISAVAPHAGAGRKADRDRWTGASGADRGANGAGRGSRRNNRFRPLRDKARLGSQPDATGRYRLRPSRPRSGRNSAGTPPIVRPAIHR